MGLHKPGELDDVVRAQGPRELQTHDSLAFQWRMRGQMAVQSSYLRNGWITGSVIDWWPVACGNAASLECCETNPVLSTEPRSMALVLSP